MTDEQPQVEKSRAGGEPPGVPGWVKGLAIGFGVLVVLAIVVMLLSGGQHGPGMHG